MRDIRNDLQDRADLLEEQINAADAQFESLVEQLRTEHESRIEDLKAEFEAVTRLLEVEQRRLANIPVTPAPAPKPQPRAQSQSQPHAQSQSQPHVQSQSQPHVQSQSQPHAQMHAPAHAQTHAPSHAQPYMQSRAQHNVQHAQPDPHIQQAQQELVQQAQPQQPLGDFLVRRLNEQGAMSRDDLRVLAVQEGYFDDGEVAERSVHAALISVNKAGLIRQLPNGNFAPASMMDAIRLRRAI